MKNAFYRKTGMCPSQKATEGLPSKHTNCVQYSGVASNAPTVAVARAEAEGVSAEKQLGSPSGKTDPSLILAYTGPFSPDLGVSRIQPTSHSLYRVASYTTDTASHVWLFVFSFPVILGHSSHFHAPVQYLHTYRCLIRLDYYASH